MAVSRACIVGIGETEYTRRGGITDRGEFQLAFEAILKAAEDAGVRPSEIDGFASFSNDRNEPALMQMALGAERLRFASMVWTGGGGGSCGAVAHAAAAVEAGQAHAVAVYRGLCQGQGGRFGQYQRWNPHSHFLAPFGLHSPAQGAALMVRRHMHLYGTTAEQFGRVALTCRRNAQRNPRAIMRKDMTMEAYLASRMIADPIRLFDCCLESDGACAVIVTTEERARDLPGRPVRILAAGQGGGPRWGTGFLGGNNVPDEDFATANARGLGKDLFARAGLRPDDIDVAQLYDAFTAFVIFALEDYGFCRVGEGGLFVEQGAIDWPDGRLPANTSGGHLSEAYVHGLSLVVEAVRQIRGDSASQVENAETCFVGGGPSVTPTSALILGA